MESLKLINQIRKAGRGGPWKKVGKVSIVKLRITMKYIFKKEEICKRCISCKVKLIMFSVFSMMSRWHNKPIAFGLSYENKEKWYWPCSSCWPCDLCRNLPAWYKSALFNELYYVSDGGTVWIDPVEGRGGELVRVTDPQDPPIIQEYSRFGYLEGR